MRRLRPDRWYSSGMELLVAWLVAGMVLLLPAGALAAQACVQPGSGIGGTGAPQGGIGGTGRPGAGGTGGTGDRAGSGVGGTGAVAGGIGGTGEQADSGVGGTGIVGTITGFASVCIGELEVHYDATTPVSINGQPGSLNRLALGQVVAMEAGPGAKGLTARSIAILNALEGPVTRIEAARGVLEVMGQPVRLAVGLDASRIAAGTAVRVSGLRDMRGVVHATRVEAAADLREASAIGFVRGVGVAASLDGLAFAGPSGPAGTELLIRGKWDGRRLQVRERRSDPSLPFADRVREVVVEGLVHGRTAQTLQISGFEVRFGPAVRLSGDVDGGIAEGSRVRVVGRIESGRRIVAARIEIERGRGGVEGHGASGGGRSSNSAGSSDDESSAGSENRGGDGRSGDDGGGRGSGGRGGSDQDSGDRSGGSGDRGGGSSSDRAGRQDKVEKVEKVEKIEKSDKVEKVEKLEKVQRVEKPERSDKAQGRTEKSVKPESGRSGRN